MGMYSWRGCEEALGRIALLKWWIRQKCWMFDRLTNTFYLRSLSALGSRPGRLFHPGRHTKPEMDYIFVCENKLSVLNESAEKSESLATRIKNIAPKGIAAKWGRRRVTKVAKMNVATWTATNSSKIYPSFGFSDALVKIEIKMGSGNIEMNRPRETRRSEQENDKTNYCLRCWRSGKHPTKGDEMGHSELPSGHLAEDDWPNRRLIRRTEQCLSGLAAIIKGVLLI